jgi:putative glutamine amidotransferase
MFMAHKETAYGRRCTITNKPLIGIPTFHDTTLPDKLPKRFAMSRPYITALNAVGAAPVLIPLALDYDTLRVLYDRMDGIFLAGGGDLDPSCYGQGVHFKTEGVDSLRDEAELILARWALEEGKPLFGVCRGAQALNVAAGGTLIQDISDFLPNAMRHQYYPEFPREHVAHGINVVDGTRLNGILGSDARINSFHHQAIDKVAPGFRVSAYAPDGVIEAIEHDVSGFALAVQWHPESLVPTDEGMRALFEAFIKAA